MLADAFTHTAGFGGLCAVAAAIIAFAAAALSTHQRRQADTANLRETQRRRELEAHDHDVQRCWDRYVWLIDQADNIGIDLVISLLARLTESAEKLGEPDLVAFTREFTLDLFAAAGGAYPSREPGETGTLDDDAHHGQEEQP